MASEDFLKMLSSGASFKIKGRKELDNQRPIRANTQLSVSFFSTANRVASGTKRYRDSAERPAGDVMVDSGQNRNIPHLLDGEVPSPLRPDVTKSSLQLFGTAGGKPSADDRYHETGEDNHLPRSSAIQVHAEEIAAFRRRMGIRVRGENVADPMEAFGAIPPLDSSEQRLQTRRVILENVERSEWKEPTPIQMQAVPVLVDGRDVLATAPTGSGKTAAFVIPMILMLGNCKREAKGRGVRALLLAPTRELAAQIHREVERLSIGRKLRISLLTQAGATKAATLSGADHECALADYDVVISTPMRLVALLRQGAISLSRVELVVLDEADKLFDAGAEGGGDRTFVAQIDEVLAACSSQCVQRALFSATISQKVMELAETVLRDHILITVGTPNAGAAEIDQRLVYVGREEGKLLAMRQLVRDGLRPPVLVFLQSRDRAKELFHELVYDGINVDVMHASRTQDQRDKIIQRFRTGEIWVLICTDLMARGIDFKGVNMVINYDFPQSAVSYIHRIGRTGRAGRQGVAVTLFTEADMDSLRSIANVMQLSGCKVPEWMLSMKRQKTRRNKRKLGAPRRPGITTVSKYDMNPHRRRMTIQRSKKV